MIPPLIQDKTCQSTSTDYAAKTNLQDVFLSKMKRFVDFKCWKNAKHPIEVSTFGSEAAAIGAALLFSDKIYQNAVESESSLPIRQ